MSEEEIIGYIGSVTVGLLQLPQVIKTYQTKKASDLSWGMIFLNMFASIIWFIYGIILVKFPIILANSIYFIANISIFIMKIKYQDDDINQIKNTETDREIINV